MLGPTNKTDRGFERIEFFDRNGQPCRLQQASLADFEAPGTRSLWIGSNLLNDKQVAELVEHCQAWLGTGSMEARTGG